MLGHEVAQCLDIIWVKRLRVATPGVAREEGEGRGAYLKRRSPHLRIPATG